MTTKNVIEFVKYKPTKCSSIRFGFITCASNGREIIQDLSDEGQYYAEMCEIIARQKVNVSKFF